MVRAVGTGRGSEQVGEAVRAGERGCGGGAAVRAGRARPSPCRMSSEASLAAASSSAGPHSSRTARRTIEMSRGAATSQSCEQAGQAMLRQEGPHRCGLVATTGVTLLARTPPCEAWRTYPVAPSRRAPRPPAVAARLPSPSRQARGPSRSHCVWKGVCSHGLGASAVLAWAGPAGPTATTTGARPRGCERSIAYVVDLWHAAGANRRKHTRARARLGLGILLVGSAFRGAPTPLAGF